MLLKNLDDMDAKLVSIIMPAYNGEKFVEQAIESVIAQTYSKWELVVVDDGSEDRTASILSAFKDSRIKYFYQENKGQASALNHGLDVAQGDYITTLDVDDWLTPNSVFDRVYFLDTHPEFGVVYGDGVYCDINGNPLMRFSENRVGDVTGNVYDALIATPFFGTGGNVMVRREAFENDHIRYDESIIWCQDYDVYIRIAEQTAFGVIDAVLIWYRLHDTNMTMSMPAGRRLESLIQMKNKALSSRRFSDVSMGSKIKFFHQFLVYDLAFRVNDQKLVIESDHFRALPQSQQARLLRLVANHYLFFGENVEFAGTLLDSSWALDPLSLKTVLTLISARLHPELAKWMLRQWQHWSMQDQKYDSPFEMATRNKK